MRADCLMPFWPRLRPLDLTSDEHFTVDGTLIEAWASLKSVRAKDGSDDPPEGGGRNPERDFHGQKRKNDTHESSTDPESRLYRKGRGKEAPILLYGSCADGDLTRGMGWVHTADGDLTKGQRHGGRSACTHTA